MAQAQRRPNRSSTGKGDAGSDEMMAFLPSVLEEGTFYLADDPEQLADTVACTLSPGKFANM